MSETTMEPIALPVLSRRGTRRLHLLLHGPDRDTMSAACGTCSIDFKNPWRGKNEAVTREIDPEAVTCGLCRRHPAWRRWKQGLREITSKP
jgi:hypothetical protein